MAGNFGTGPLIQGPQHQIMNRAFISPTKVDNRTEGGGGGGAGGISSILGNLKDLASIGTTLSSHFAELADKEKQGNIDGFKDYLDKAKLIDHKDAEQLNAHHAAYQKLHPEAKWLEDAKAIVAKTPNDNKYLQDKHSQEISTNSFELEELRKQYPNASPGDLMKIQETSKKPSLVAPDQALSEGPPPIPTEVPIPTEEELLQQDPNFPYTPLGGEGLPPVGVLETPTGVPLPPPVTEVTPPAPAIIPTTVGSPIEEVGLKNIAGTAHPYYMPLSVPDPSLPPSLEDVVHKIVTRPIVDKQNPDVDAAHEMRRRMMSIQTHQSALYALKGHVLTPEQIFEIGQGEAEYNKSYRNYMIATKKNLPHDLEEWNSARIHNVILLGKAIRDGANEDVVEGITQHLGIDGVKELMKTFLDLPKEVLQWADQDYALFAPHLKNAVDQYITIENAENAETARGDRHTERMENERLHAKIDATNEELRIVRKDLAEQKRTNTADSSSSNKLLTKDAQVQKSVDALEKEILISRDPVYGAIKSLKTHNKNNPTVKAWLDYLTDSGKFIKSTSDQIQKDESKRTGVYSSLKAKDDNKIASIIGEGRNPDHEVIARLARLNTPLKQATDAFYAKQEALLSARHLSIDKNSGKVFYTDPTTGAVEPYNPDKHTGTMIVYDGLGKRHIIPVTDEVEAIKSLGKVAGLSNQLIAKWEEDDAPAIHRQLLINGVGVVPTSLPLPLGDIASKSAKLLQDELVTEDMMYRTRNGPMSMDDIGKAMITANIIPNLHEPINSLIIRSFCNRYQYRWTHTMKMFQPGSVTEKDPKTGVEKERPDDINMNGRDYVEGEYFKGVVDFKGAEK